MKPAQTRTSSSLLIDFGHSSLRVLDGEGALTLSIERQTNGHLTQHAKEETIFALKNFLGSNWRPRRRALCAIAARGVSLRRLRLPASAQKNLKDMLALQVERELPLPPSELAWGYRRIEKSAMPARPGQEEQVLLAAVRRDLVEEVAGLLGACRLTPVFTPGILSLLSLCPNPPPAHAVLDIGRRQSELLGCRDGSVDTLRILPFGGDNITAAIAGALGITEDDADRLKIQWSENLANDAAQSAAIERAVQAAFVKLASLVAAAWNGDRLYLAGKSALAPNALHWLSESLGSTTACELSEKSNNPASSATLEALKIENQPGRREPPLLLQSQATEQRQANVASAALWKWAALAAILAFASISFRYSEPLLRKPGLERRLAKAATEQTAGPEIVQELDFLQHIDAQRSPYLAVLTVLGEATPRGARFESLSMNRRGEISFQTTLRGSEQAIDLRSKLIDSGVFSSVVVEEQLPSPQDRNKLIVRIIARCTPDPETPGISSPSRILTSTSSR